MTCLEFRDQLLDSIGQELSRSLKDHVLVCMECRQFSEIHLELHARFLSASAEYLSPAFRQSLGKRLAPDRVANWPDYLPDIAHLTGCITATLVSVFVLPWPAASVLVTGAVFTGFTYLLQAKLRDALQGESFS